MTKVVEKSKSVGLSTYNLSKNHHSSVTATYSPNRPSPLLVVTSSEPEDEFQESDVDQATERATSDHAPTNMASIAETLVKMDDPTHKVNEALNHTASDDDDDDDDDDSGDDTKPKGKKGNGKSRRELPTGAVATLKQWLLSPEHFTHPYPTPQDQLMLMQKTGIDKKQLKNWFTNARRRIWKPMLKKQLEQGKLTAPGGMAGGNVTLLSASSVVGGVPSGMVMTQQHLSAPVSAPATVSQDPLQLQQQQYPWQGQQQFGDASHANAPSSGPMSGYSYPAQYPLPQLSAQQQDQQQQIGSMNPSSSIGSLAQISSFGSTGQMIKTDSHAVLMELFARDQDLVRQAAKGAKLKAQAAVQSAVQAQGHYPMQSSGNGAIQQSMKMVQAANVPTMNSWPHFSSVSSLNNLGSLAGVKSIQNLSAADLASQAGRKGSLAQIKSQESMGRADSYSFLEIFFDNAISGGRGIKREREEDNDVGLSLDADESPSTSSKPLDVVSSVTRPAPLPIGETDESEELKRNYDDALAARGLLSVSRSSEKLTDLPMKMQRTLSQEFLRHQFGGSSFCSSASWGQPSQLPWDVQQSRPGEDIQDPESDDCDKDNDYKPYQVSSTHASAPQPTPLSDPSMASASVEVPASTRCALCHQTNVDTQLRPCGHMFHGRCLKPSLQNAMGPPTCPIDSIPMQSAVLAVPADSCHDLRGGAL